MIPRGPATQRAPHRLDAQGLLPAILGCIHRGDDDRRTAIHRRIAIVETEGFGNHAGRKVIVQCHRVAVDRLGVEPRVAPGVERNLRHLLPGGPEFVEMAACHHGDPYRRRRGAIGEGPLHEPARSKTPSAPGADARAWAAALGGGLPDRAKTEHMTRKPGRHRHAGVDHRAELAGQFGTAAKPIDLQAEHVLDFGDSRPAKTRRARDAASGIGRNAVDVLPAKAGILDGVEAGIGGQRQGVPAQAATHRRLADPGNRRAAFQPLGLNRRHRRSRPWGRARRAE